TFPIQVTPKFFQAIHPFLPFTYAVDALREAVGGVVPEILIYNIIFLVLFGVVIFTIGFIVKLILDPWKNKTSKRAEDSYLMAYIHVAKLVAQSVEINYWIGRFYL